MKKVDSACLRPTTDRIIRFEENKRKILFINSSLLPYIAVRVDGCAITHGVRCDHLLISGDALEERYVELKGTDVRHAIQQLEVTIQTLGEHDFNRHSYVICTNVVPRVRTDMQIWAKRFKNKYNSELVIRSKEHSVTLN